MDEKKDGYDLFGEFLAGVFGVAIAGLVLWYVIGPVIYIVFKCFT